MDEPKFMKLRDREEPWQVGVVKRLIREGKLRICDICHKPFKPRHKEQKRCCFACKQEANRRNSREYQRIKHKRKPKEAKRRCESC